MASLREKILVVDGDPDVLDLVANQVLVPQNYLVATADNGQTALQMALKLAPDVLLTALDLPGLSGRDLLAALRAQGFESIIIATGPKGADALAVQAFRLGAKDYLSKPLREAEIVATVDRALSELRLRREREQLGQRLAAANQQLEKRVKDITTLYGIGKAVTGATDQSQLFDKLLEGAMQVSEGEVAWLQTLEEGSQRLMLRATRGLPPPVLAGALIKLNAPWDDGLSSLLLLSGEGISLAGEPLAKMRAGKVARAVLAAPIKAKDRVLGVLAVGNKSGKPFVERDQGMLAAVADYASIALVNTALFQTIETRARSLQKSFDDMAELARQKDDAVYHITRELFQPLSQARDSLEQVGRGALSPQQSTSLRLALDRLDALGRAMQGTAFNSEAALRPPKPRPTHLQELVRESLARMAGEARERGVTLSAELPPETINAYADPAQVSRVLDSLITHALKASPKGGYVTARLRLSGVAQATISIVDTGAGLTPEQLTAVWAEPAKGAPAGDNLHLIKRIIEAHAGQVWAESEPNRGSRFHFSLKVA